MSVHVISWVLKHSEARLGDRLVLIVLADHASEDGTNAYPTLATIAQQARMSRRQVQRALRNLETQGLIKDRGRTDWGARRFDVAMSDLSPKPSLGNVSSTVSLDAAVSGGSGDKSDQVTKRHPLSENVCTKCGLVLDLDATACPCEAFE